MCQATAMPTTGFALLLLTIHSTITFSTSSVKGEIAPRTTVVGTFSFDGISQPPELSRQGNTTIYEDGKIWLTPNPNEQKVDHMGNLTGRLVCTTPLGSLGGINSLDDVVSMQSAFDFQFIIGEDRGGDGMAFFISPDGLSIPDNSFGEALGIDDDDVADLTDESLHLFAVEFDTYMNPRLRDPSDNHVGIDIDSLVSAVAVNTSAASAHPDLDLYSNSSFRAWVDYHSANHSVEVRMINLRVSGADRPLDPLLNLTYDLSSLLRSSSRMFVGLSATTGYNFQGCAISSWNFTLAVLQPSALAPTAAPAAAAAAASPPAITRTPNPTTSIAAVEPSRTNGVLRPYLVPGIAGAGVAAVVAVLAVALILAYRKRCCSSSPRGNADADAGAEGLIGAAGHHGNAKFAQIPHDALVPAAMPRYTVSQLSKATQGFHDKAKVGCGGYSTVYKGKLMMMQAAGTVYDSAGMRCCEVAVKRLNKEGLRKIEEFFAEIKVIHGLRHPRLVELKGWCYESGEAMLVYEFMGNGSLADRLFARGKKKGAANDSLLSSEVRVGILKGVAEALAHVHAAGAVHRDVKAANVLLSGNMDAKLGDFGLLRLLKDERQMTQTMTAAGTPGYSAPELLFTRTPADKADVYSYGVLMLEVACGRRAIDVGLMEEPDTPQVLLLDWVWSKHERDELMSVLDPKMFNGGRIDEEEEEGGRGIWRCIVHLALRCCHPIPEERPPMKEVLESLERGVLVAVDHCRPVYRPAPAPLPRGLLSAEVDDTSGPTTESSSGSCGPPASSRS